MNPNGDNVSCIASKLFSTESGGCRINGKNGHVNGNNEVQKVAEKHISSERVFQIGDSFQVNNTGLGLNVHCWKEKTTVIADDSILNGLDECCYLSSKGNVNVRAFPGSTKADIRDHYIQPLLEKRPSSVIIHRGTNDASQEGANADEIKHALFDLEAEVEKNIEGSKYIYYGFFHFLEKYFWLHVGWYLCLLAVFHLVAFLHQVPKELE